MALQTGSFDTCIMRKKTGDFAVNWSMALAGFLILVYAPTDRSFEEDAISDF